MGDVLSLPTLEVSRVLGCDDELVADATPLDPLANEGLGSLVLAVLSINEITCPNGQGRVLTNCLQCR